MRVLSSGHDIVGWREGALLSTLEGIRDKFGLGLLVGEAEGLTLVGPEQIPHARGQLSAISDGSDSVPQYASLLDSLFAIFHDIHRQSCSTAGFSMRGNL